MDERTEARYARTKIRNIARRNGSVTADTRTIPERFVDDAYAQHIVSPNQRNGAYIYSTGRVDLSIANDAQASQVLDLLADYDVRVVHKWYVGDGADAVQIITVAFQ